MGYGEKHGILRTVELECKLKDLLMFMADRNLCYNAVLL